MIISPPFLPANNNLTEDAWIDAAMPLDLPAGAAPRGNFPVGQNLGWHGGVHLVAPMNGTAALPVRAIADGSVIYVRQPSPVTTVATQPLNYNPALLGPKRTDDGCVVIRHETEIGGTAEGVATRLTYYSIYMHLATVTCATQTVAGVAQPQATPFSIYRKDEIGTAGQIYGEPNRIHFEIIFDDAALQNALGRALTRPPPGTDGKPAAHTLDLAATASGRSDAVFGEIYFRLPIGTAFYAARPALNATTSTAAPTNTLTAELIVGMKFAAGDGALANRGDISYRSYQLDGTEIGTAIVETDGEYNLYTTAKSISTAYPVAGRPAPSAVYELLRFGRIIDTANETLAPADVPLWKDVNFTGGHGWVNLHATGVQVYSDADLPQWKGWQVVDSDVDGDSRCDAARIRAILDQDGNGTITPAEATARIGAADIRKKLSRFLCKMPTEWEEASIDIRWGWLRTNSAENPNAFDDTRDYQPFKAHVAALCFWQPANLGIPATHWHAHPVEFIRLFRKCGWFAEPEIVSTFPKFHIYEKNAGGNYVAHTADSANLYQISRAQATARISNYRINLCKVFRKYTVIGWKRQTHFLAQTMLETDKWRTMREYGKGQANKDIPMAQYYAAFYGRGIMQLTWAGNYKSYGEFRKFANVTSSNYGESLGRITSTSTHYMENPLNEQGQVVGVPLVWYPKYDPETVADSHFEACNSGGFYFVSKPIGNDQLNILRVCDRDFGITSVGRVCVLVNGGAFGYHERQAYACFMENVLGDTYDNSQTKILTTPKGTVIVNMAKGS